MADEALVWDDPVLPSPIRSPRGFLDLASRPQLRLEGFLRHMLSRVVALSSSEAAACLLLLPDGSVPSPEIRSAAVRRDGVGGGGELLARWNGQARPHPDILSARWPRQLEDLDGLPAAERLVDEGRSALLIPLREGRRSFGLLRAESTRVGHYSDAILDEIRNLTDGAIPAIYRLLLREQLQAAGSPMELIGTSPALLALEHQLKRAAAFDKAPVLITGERGTGKELAAWAIHCWSTRHDRPFVPVLMSGLPDTLAADELFGHERHAFTGAEGKRLGKFEAAGGGTVFLDEVADINPAVQAALLRVIESKELARLGRDLPVQVTARVMAATNKDLVREMEEGRFRQDLFDRLTVFEIRIPPLRDRWEDIPQLADYFLRQYCTELERRDELGVRDSCRFCRHPGRIGCATPDFYEALGAYSWPGNVRELKHLMFRLVATVQDDFIDAHHLPERFLRSRSGGSAPVVDNWSLEAATRRHIEAVLQLTDHNKSQAARMLGIPYTTFQSKLKKLGIRPAKGGDDGGDR